MAKLAAIVAVGLGLLAVVSAGGVLHARSGHGHGGWGGWVQEGWAPPKVIEHHRHIHKVYNHDHHEHKILEHDHHEHKVHEHHQHKKVINRDHLHKHNLHIHNVHQHLLNRHKIHEHNLHKHNLHVTHVLEPVIHTYHKTQHKVHPYVSDEHKVIPHHETVYKQHEHHVKAHPVVLEHKGWEAPAQPGWGAAVVAVEPEGYHHSHEGYRRRSDVNVAEESSPVAAVAQPDASQVVAIQLPAELPAPLAA